MRSYAFIDIERLDGGITIARFQHPPTGEVGLKQLSDLSRLFPDLNSDRETQVLVITGHGNAFFTGPDLSGIVSMRDSPDLTLEVMREARRTTYSLIDFEKPIVAAVNGDAVGVGAQIALLSDIVVAAESASFWDTHVRIGVTAGDGGAIWPLLMGLPRAKLHLLTGRRLSARDAYEAGAIAQVVDDGAVEATALDFARRLLSMPQFALHSTKAALNQWLRLSALVAGDYSHALELAAQFTPAAREATQRAIERVRKSSAQQ